MVRLHSSGGVVSRTPAVRKQARMQRVKEYFYGVRGDLSPHSQTVRLDDLRIYRIGGGPRAPTSALPIGTPPVLLLPCRLFRWCSPSLVCIFGRTALPPAGPKCRQAAGDCMLSTV